jgi:hypothetical protein
MRRHQFEGSGLLRSIMVNGMVCLNSEDESVDRSPLIRPLFECRVGG